MAQPGLVYKSHRVRSSYVVLLHLEWGVCVCFIKMDVYYVPVDQWWTVCSAELALHWISEIVVTNRRLPTNHSPPLLLHTGKEKDIKKDKKAIKETYLNIEYSSRSSYCKHVAFILESIIHTETY